MEFLFGVLLGVVVGVIGTALTPWVKHVVPQPGRRQAAMAEIGRAAADYEVWLEKANIELKMEQQQVLEEMEARGILASGITQNRQRELMEKYTAEQKAQLRVVFRRVHDAAATLGPIEHWHVRRQVAGKKVADESLEELVFGEPEI